MKPSCFPAFFKQAKLWASSYLGPMATMGSSFFFLSAKCVVFSRSFGNISTLFQGPVLSWGNFSWESCVWGSRFSQPQNTEEEVEAVWPFFRQPIWSHERESVLFNILVPSLHCGSGECWWEAHVTGAELQMFKAQGHSCNLELERSVVGEWGPRVFLRGAQPAERNFLALFPLGQVNSDLHCCPDVEPGDPCKLFWSYETHKPLIFVERMDLHSFLWFKPLSLESSGKCKYVFWERQQVKSLSI